jgi:hypothetical protein
MDLPADAFVKDGVCHFLGSYSRRVDYDSAVW